MLSKLEKELSKAKTREKTACAALAKKHKGGEWEEYNSSREEVLICERKLASAKTEPYAERIEFPVKWDVGAPLPHLFINDHKAYLSFYIQNIEPNWDGTYVKVVDLKDERPASLALVEFKQCTIAKLGSPNDEVFHGHPLEGKGIEAYTPLKVKNSTWIEEIKNINKVHSNYKEENWTDCNHFIFGFHDTTFECIADSFEVETYNVSMAELMDIICKKLLE